MGCTQGSQAKLLVEPGSSDYTFDSDSERYDFLYESIAKQGRLVGGRAITGTRSAYANVMREGHYSVGGKLGMYTNPSDLDLWLPRILGGPETGTGGDTFEVAEALTGSDVDFGMLIDRVGGIFQYDDCLVNSCFWRGKAGPGDGEPELIEQVLDIMALDETLGTSWPSPAPELSVADNRSPYIMADSTVTIGTTTYAIKAFVILIDNRLEPRWVNSTKPTALCPRERVVMVRMTFPFTASDDAVFSGLYQNSSRHDGVSASIAFAPSGKGYSTTFNFEGLQWVQQSPGVQGKREIPLTLDFVARKTSVDTDEVSVANDSSA